MDRKKNIFKLSQGEYVAPEKIENVLVGSMLIGQCFVYGDSFQSALVAVVVPDEEPSKAWATKQDDLVSKLSFSKLCQSTQLKEAIMADIHRLSKAQGLHGFETPKAIYLESNLFTTENDLVTPTFKLKRNKLKDNYEHQINEMYASLPAPISKL